MVHQHSIGSLISSRWLHRQFMHFDANFRLTLQKHKKRGEGSVSLWGSSGFFVDRHNYQRYLDTSNTPQREAGGPYSASSTLTIAQSSDCVDHKALLHVTKSRFESLEVSGVAGAVCRHECAIPQSFVNLSHGER
jgi:Kyakuja-Dileera-Zisupton transposase